MTVQNIIRQDEIAAVAKAMKAGGVSVWSVHIVTSDGRKMTVSAGGSAPEAYDDLDSMVYAKK